MIDVVLGFHTNDFRRRKPLFNDTPNGFPDIISILHLHVSLSLFLFPFNRSTKKAAMQMDELVTSTKTALIVWSII